MESESERYDSSTGLPKNGEYLERGLPRFLRDSINAMNASWEIEDSGKDDLHWDIYWCDLYADINCAEVEHLISGEQAQYLRRKYLRMKTEE